MDADRSPFTLFLAVLLWAAAAGLPAQETDSRKVVSSTGRFVALSPAEMDATYLVVWAEDVAERLENLIGLPLPVPREEAVYLIIGDGSGEISAEQYYDEFGLRQKLYIRGAAQADQEYLLECLCHLLLNRKARLQVPFWFAAGAAQNLFPEARARNNDAALAEWTADQAPDFADITVNSGTRTPNARERAFAGQAVAAMLQWLSEPAQVEQFFALCASGSQADTAAIAQLAGFHSSRDLEAAWDVWLASRQRVRTVGTGSPQQDAARLREMLRLTPELVLLTAGQEIPEEISFQRLIRERKQVWVPLVAAHLGLKLESFALGSATETQQVIQAWRKFLSAVPAVEDERPRFFLHLPARKSDKELRSMLKRAEGMLETLESGPERP